jgi:hypothetical protein
MGKFSKAVKDRQSGGGSWWKAGKHRARITKVEFRNGHTGESYIVEGEVLSSTNPEIKVGETRSQVIKLDKASAAGNIGSFVCVCAAMLTGKNLDNPDACEIDESDIEASYGPDQPFVGLEVDVEGIDIKTRAGGDFTKIVYSVPEDVRQSAAA